MLYGAVPPVGVITALPSAAPLHVALVGVAVAVGPGVSSIFTVVGYKHPLASLTTTECGPGARFGYEVFVVKGLLSTEYVYGGVPPVAFPISSDPLLNPHVAFVGVSARSVGPVVFAIFAISVYTHPFASMT